MAELERAVWETARALLEKAGLTSEGLRLERHAGGNNQVFRGESASGPFILKRYFRHADDTRDRLAAEFDWLDHAARHALPWVPRILACDATAGFTLFEAVGQPFTGAPDEADVAAAAAFFAAMNAPASRAAAGHLPSASESCFSLECHLARVKGRLEELARGLSAPVGALEREAAAMVDLLAEIQAGLADATRARACSAGIDPTAELAADERCLSPSDFGFHNALRRPTGDLCFVDFEYAGWDDPAKMVGDFFAQLAVPVPIRHFDAFVLRAMSPFASAARIETRARLLLPVYRMKWCCIALNVFLPVHWARRRFARPDMDGEAERRARLGAARKLLLLMEAS